MTDKKKKLEDALRANLLKRKQQTRARDAAPDAKDKGKEDKK
jgi:hypothetical protein